MNFNKFLTDFTDHLNAMLSSTPSLFEVELTPDDRTVLYNLYLDNFPPEHNKLFRERRELDCNACKQFIRNFGGVVIIKEDPVTGEPSMETIWNFGFDNPEYGNTTKKLDTFIQSRSIDSLYMTNTRRIGTDKTIGQNKNGEVEQWEHLHAILPATYVKPADFHGTLRGNAKTGEAVFYRSLNEITLESIDTVLELIAQDSLYRGAEWKNQLKTFRAYKEEFERQSSEKAKHLKCWKWYLQTGEVIAHMRNHSIGTLLTDISQGMDLETAVKRYENIVAPTNYKRPKAIFTQKMLDDAKAKLEEMGYMNSLGRRFARLDDVTVNNVLFADRSVVSRMKQSNANDVFAAMSAETKKKPLSFDRVEEIHIEKFLSDVLPSVSKVEAYVEGKHTKNLVSLIAPKDPEAPSMFKWDNPFSWAYAGNIADSDIRQNVEKAGGSVTGDLRFSIQWNDKGNCNDDLDAHCKAPNGHIYFADRRIGTGELDVDIVRPERNVAVENITWPSRSAMPDGTYAFWVHCFARRTGDNSFRAEIEFDGTIYTYSHSNELRTGESVKVATVTKKGSQFTITHHLSSDQSSKEVWNIQTNNFIPVSLICYSPNYWNETTGIGNKHYFFLLKDCQNPDSPSGFFNEYLKNELLEHKRVFEALGSRMSAEPDENQLSGLGFSETQRNELVVKVTGTTERMLKIKF